MDGIWIGVIIVGVLIVAFGPILYVLPTKKDRRLAALRAQARQLGLTVSLKPVRNPDAAPEDRVTAGGRLRVPMHASARYALALDQMRDEAPPWRLLRSTRGWIADEGMDLPAGWLDSLQPLIETLPDDVVAVDCGGRDLGCFWLERPTADTAAVDKLKESLASIGSEVATLAAEADASVLSGKQV